VDLGRARDIGPFLGRTVFLIFTRTPFEGSSHEGARRGPPSAVSYPPTEKIEPLQNFEAHTSDLYHGETPSGQGRRPTVRKGAGFSASGSTTPTSARKQRHGPGASEAAPGRSIRAEKKQRHRKKRFLTLTSQLVKGAQRGLDLASAQFSILLRRLQQQGAESPAPGRSSPGGKNALQRSQAGTSGLALEPKKKEGPATRTPETAKNPRRKGGRSSKPPTTQPKERLLREVQRARSLRWHGPTRCRLEAGSIRFRPASCCLQEADFVARPGFARFVDEPDIGPPTGVRTKSRSHVGTRFPGRTWTGNRQYGFLRRFLSFRGSRKCRRVYLQPSTNLDFPAAPQCQRRRPPSSFGPSHENVSDPAALMRCT